MTLAKIQVTAIFFMQGFNFAQKLFTQICRDLYGDAILEPINPESCFRSEAAIEILRRSQSKL